MTDTFTTEDLLNELQQYHNPTVDRREGGVTRQEFADEQNCSTKHAKKMLEELVEQGILMVEFSRLAPNAQGYVYYKKCNSSNGE